ncbi:MAG: DUF2461 domain-containing protein [Burkholderiaceae bacterium]|jgi:uncharacterized protein (TIGR02453 family)
MHLPALVQFLQGLSENNNKAWFVMNQPSYAILREEFTAVVADVIKELGRTDASIATLDPKKALFRIYRDVRFSHDKTPYKTTFSAALAAQGKKSQAPMYYFHIDAAGKLLVAAGCYLPPPPALLTIRRAIAADPARLKRISRGAKLVQAFGGLDLSDGLTRPPKGFDASSPGIDFIKLKSYIVSHESRLTKSSGPRLATTIAERLASALPLVAWLREVLAETKSSPS